MKAIVRPRATYLRVENTPEALFKAAGVLALAAVVLTLLKSR